MWTIRRHDIIGNSFSIANLFRIVYCIVQTEVNRLLFIPRHSMLRQESRQYGSSDQWR